MLQNNKVTLSSQENIRSRKTFIEIIRDLEITDKKEYLSEEQLKDIFAMYDYREINSFSYNKYLKYLILRNGRFVEKYPNFNYVANASSTEIRKMFTEFGLLKMLLVYILSGRIRVDNEICISGLFKIEEILTVEEIRGIKCACENYKYSMTSTFKGVLQYIARIILVKGILLNEITMNDIYDCYRSRFDKANATTNVLKYLNILDEVDHYIVNNRKTIGKANNIDISVKNDYYKKEYESYENFVDNEGNSKSNKYIRKIVTKLFLNWLDDQYGCIYFNELDFQLIVEFVIYLKKMKNVNGKNYKDSSYIAMKSQYNIYLQYLINNNKVKNKFIIDYHKTNIFNGEISEIIYEKELITKEEIKKIEYEIINFNEYQLMPYAPDILKLLYFYGMRPCEGIHLLYDCLKGTEDAPTLYIHNSKNGEDRYIPLTKQGYNIIKKYMEINKNSLPIYSDYDGLNVKRLFAYRNKLINKTTLNERLKELEVNAGIVNEEGKAKYPLYTLRKIRITIWLEAGFTIEEVSRLAGHRDVESQNYYYISKENRLDSAKSVFNEIYDKYIDEYGNMDEELYYLDQEKEEEDYMKELERDLLIIENKEVFNYVTRMAQKDYPELFFPLMNGVCGAMVEEDGDFECEMLKLPCLECDDLKSTEDNRESFDKFAINLYKNKNLYIKNGIEGLEDKSNNMIERLKKFYIKNFNLNEEEVEKYFSKLDEKAIVKRGRKKKQNK